ncbi:MAG TPA: LacI family DNA-binding transcriptional regulator [Devosia sp.]
MVTTRKVPTIQDVARQAKVSAATVSRVLSNPERVSEATRERVTQAVRETGYTINQAARSLRLRAARTILIALPDIGNPFYSNVLDAVVDEAALRGYGVLVANRFAGDASRLLNDYFLSSRADGLLLFDGGVDTALLQVLAMPDGHVPLVVSFDEVPKADVAAVLMDNLEAAERATAYLIGLGHRKIGHIIGPSRNAEPNPRLIGFQNAMRRAKLEVRPEWLFPGDYSMETGIAAAQAMLKSSELPTAVFSANDEMAIGLISTLRDAGVECPRDISVIGFDDITVASQFYPRLTTMRQPREQIGRLVTDSLIDILEGAAAPGAPRRIILRSDLIIRESTRALP